MGLISRLGNLWKGFISIWISDIEKDHPEIAYENAINSMITKYAKLKGATAAIIRRRQEKGAAVYKIFRLRARRYQRGKRKA